MEKGDDPPGCAIAIFITVVIFVFSFWTAVGCVAVHFIRKFW